MCGISGFVNFSSDFRFSASQLDRSSKILSHRGLDNEGFLFLSPDNEFIESHSDEFGQPDTRPNSRNINTLIDKNWPVGLMHRRLSIIDPTPEGHQPFSDELGLLWLDFNGEIYNYCSLRTELQSAGYQFNTQTDTEVLLNAYRHWGADCVHHLDGMWSFVVLDIKKQKLFASTDRTGIKPFYYFSDETGFCFASEIKAFAAFNVPFLENEQAVCRYLAYGLTDETSETFFQTIYRLEAGNNLEIDLQTHDIQVNRYHDWTINRAFDFQPATHEKNRVEAIQTHLVEMIGLRMQADVPLGVCLSGGIDSSTIAGLMAFADRRTQSTQTRKAFMTTLPAGSLGDELPYAKQVANECRFHLHTIQPSASQFLEQLEDLIYTLDEPPPGPNAYSQYAVFNKVHEEGITVTLDGQGADEIFAGYPRHFRSNLVEGALHGSFPSDSMAYLKTALQDAIRSRVSTQIENRLLLWKKPEFKMLLPAVFTKAGRKEKFHLSLNEELKTEFQSSSLPFLLKAADRNSMRWSVESRMPFADFQPLVQCLFSIPGSAKIQAGWPKYLLRKAAQPFVPQAILQRKDKVGFAAPNQDWIRSIPETMWEELLAIPQNLVDVGQVRFWIKNQEKMDVLILWRVFAWLLWKKIFLPNGYK